MKAHLRLTKGQARNSEGLELLRLALWVDGRELAHVHAVSGQSWAQHFRRAEYSEPGSMEPIPEGRYRLSGPFWAIQPGNYVGEWSPALGPVVIDVTNAPGNNTRRSELRIHADWNEDGSPGTAGCIGIQGEDGPRDTRRLKLVVGWMEKYHPEDLEVDWDLGTLVPR